MTVAELIEELQKYPDDLEVWVHGDMGVIDTAIEVYKTHFRGKNYIFIES